MLPSDADLMLEGTVLPRSVGRINKPDIALFKTLLFAFITSYI